MEFISRTVVRTVLTAGIMTFALAACGTSGGGTPASEPSDSPSNVASSRIPAPATGGPATGTASPSPSASPNSSDSAIPDGTVDLKVSIKPKAEAEAKEYVLACSDNAVDSASTLPNAAGACTRVLELGTDFFLAKPDPNKMCTQQYGGPETAEVTGTINGQKISASFSQVDGCEIARWNAVQPIVGTGGAS